MNNVNIGTGSISDILTAMQSIGFTVDTSTGIARWSSDTNNKIYFKPEISGTNTVLRVYNSSNSMLNNGLTFTTSASHKMAYEKIGNSVVFGFSPVTSTGNMVQFMIAEPKDVEDHWLYATWYVGSGAQNTGKIIDGETENYIAYPSQNALYVGSANGIQLCKYYDGIRFVGNFYMSPVCTSIPLCLNANANASGNNYVEATIGSDTYLVCNLTNIQNGLGVKFAIKKTTSST